MKTSYKRKTYEEDLVEKLTYYQQRRDALLGVMYRQSNEALSMIEKRTARVGLEKTLQRLDKKPQVFGKLIGHTRFGFKTATRFEALLVKSDLLHAVRRYYAINAELESHRQNLKTAKEIEPTLDKKRLWRTRLQKLKTLVSRKEQTQDDFSRD